MTSRTQKLIHLATGGSTDNWNLQRPVRRNLSHDFNKSSKVSKKNTFSNTQEWVNSIKVVPYASSILNNVPEHSYEEEDQPQNVIHSMFDEITDLETLLAPELLSMAQTVQDDTLVNENTTHLELSTLELPLSMDDTLVNENTAHLELSTLELPLSMDDTLVNENTAHLELSTLELPLSMDDTLVNENTAYLELLTPELPHIMVNNPCEDNCELNNTSNIEESLEIGNSDVCLENIGEKRKRVSKQGDTREYRLYRKEQRNSGLKYVTNKGTTVEGRKSTPLSNCRAKCMNKVNVDLQNKLFKMYWSMKDYNRRVAYISGLITVGNKQRNRKRCDTPEKSKPREKVYNYFIPKQGEHQSVCKGCFLKVFGETSKFIRCIVVKKVNSPVSRCSPDKRGQRTPKNRFPPAVIKDIIDHIKKLPAYESHYCRKETNKKYLPPYFTLQHAYDGYTKSVNNPVSRSVYQKYFKLSGIKVKSPKKDTCTQCDQLKIQLTNTNCSEDQRIQLINQQTQHHNDAEAAYQSKRNDILAISDNTHVIAFDLQQCLPTPSLDSSVAFYKRQLWTFNFTVHNMLTSKASCYLWNETLAKRGANDMGSCIFHYLSNLPSQVTHVIMYSDCCPGQNKNSIIIAMCLYFLEHQDKIKVIDHKFMVPGHSRMECDSDHAKIEKARKRYPFPISHPHDWAQLIGWAGKNSFDVHEMNQNLFFDFNFLLKHKYQVKKKNEQGDPFIFRNVKWFRYIKENTNRIQYKTSLNTEEEFQEMNMMKRKSINCSLPKAYEDTLPISDEKKKDIISLLNLIPEVYHDFYKNIKSKVDITDPLISSDEE